MLLEMDLGEIDKGADIAALSQYPGEKEILFPPMTNLEVKGIPRLELTEEGPVMVLSIRANVSLRNETREQLEGKRKAVFMASLLNSIQETQLELDAILAQDSSYVGADWAGSWNFGKDNVRSVVVKDCADVVAKYEGHTPEWFLHDQHYQVHSASPLPCPS